MNGYKDIRTSVLTAAIVCAIAIPSLQCVAFSQVAATVLTIPKPVTVEFDQSALTGEDFDG